MAKEEDITRALSGKARWNKWAEECLANNEAPSVDFSGHKIETPSFEGFIFPGPANFSRAEFMNNAMFTDAVFHSDVKMDRTIFHGDTNFNGVEFKGSADFSHARFHWFANFNGATCKEFSFSGAEVTGEANFEGMQFERSAFAGVKFKHALSRFTGANFRHVPDFRAATFEAPPLFQRVQVTYARYQGPRLWRRWMSCAADGDDAVKFRRLKQLASDWRDHEGELEYFGKELQAKRFYETRGRGPIFLNWLYGALSNFGQSIERPVFSLFVLIALASAAILCNHAPGGPDHAIAVLGAVVASVLCRITGHVWFAWLFFGTAAVALLVWSPPALVLALSNSVPFLGPSNWWSGCSVSNAFRPECEPRALPVLLAGMQSATSLVLLFLIGLALRNRFRVG